MHVNEQLFLEMLKDLRQQEQDIIKKIKINVDLDQQNILEYSLGEVQRKIKDIEETLQRSYWLS